MHRNWSKFLAVVLVVAALSSAEAVTFTGTDTYMGIQYTATVVGLGNSSYDVNVTIDTTGYTGTKNAWLDWFKLKVSPQNPSSVTVSSKPAEWECEWGYVSAGGSVDFFSKSVGPPGASPDSSDILIPLSGTRPIITFSYRVNLSGTSLKMDEWPYQARYLLFKKYDKKGNPEYAQTIVSRSILPQGRVIPEPATLLLFGMGLAVPLGLLRRKS